MSKNKKGEVMGKARSWQLGVWPILVLSAIFVSLFLLIFLGILVSSQDSGNSAQNELNNLIEELNNQGYNWLSNTAQLSFNINDNFILSIDNKILTC